MVFATDALVIGLRALSFVALFQATGGAIFLALFGSGLGGATVERIRSLTMIAAFTALVLAVLHYVLTPARMAGTFGATFDPSLEALLLQSNAGGAHIVRFVGLALLALTLDRGSRLNKIVGSIGVALALASFALMGHTTIHPQRWLLVLPLLAHVGVAAFWFGALVPLRVLVRTESAERSGAAIARFSALATRLVPIILLCGVILSVTFIRSFAELWTGYGAMVLGKALAFGALLGLASLNKWRFAPRMVRGDAGAVALFRRTVAIEWVLLAAILVATAALTSLYAPEHLDTAFGAGHGVEPVR